MLTGPGDKSPSCSLDHNDVFMCIFIFNKNTKSIGMGIRNVCNYCIMYSDTLICTYISRFFYKVIIKMFYFCYTVVFQTFILNFNKSFIP